jgi:cysteine-rich repeat protein
LCDGTPDCATNCRSVTSCISDGISSSPPAPACDDGNIAPWDGCGTDCRRELGLVLTELIIATRGGCDFTGDGSPDNRFGDVLGVTAAFVNTALSQEIVQGNMLILLAMLGLDPEDGASDDELRVGWMLGYDSNGDHSDDLSGDGELYVQYESLDTYGMPETSIEGSIVDRALSAGPETLPLPFGDFEIRLERAQMFGTTRAGDGRIAGITSGLVCGGIPIGLMSLIGDFLRNVGGSITLAPPCGGGSPASLADLIVAGGLATIRLGDVELMLMFRAMPPDLDLDGDGLEVFDYTDVGAAGCQPVIDSCKDGDGTTIAGRFCYNRDGFLDGYSAAFEYEATGARFVGTL